MRNSELIAVYVAGIPGHRTGGETEINMPDWFVSESYYFLWDSDCLAGEFSLNYSFADKFQFVEIETNGGAEMYRQLFCQTWLIVLSFFDMDLKW